MSADGEALPPRHDPAVDDGDVAAPEGQDDPLIGAHLHGRYQILRELGWGSLGRVYLARDGLRPAGQDEVALKVIRHDRLTPQAVAFLKAEFRALWGLRHPHVARVYDLDVVPGSGELFFTLDYLPGRPLTDVAQDVGWKASLELFVQALRALAFVHARDLIHMDVKPKNVFVLGEPDGPLEVQLLDFHLARARSTEGDRKMRGTIAYMSPEVVRGEPVDHRADLYSFGAVAYEALTGHAPFSDASGSIMDVLRAQATRTPPSFAERGCQGIPPALEGIVMRLLAKKPGDRFPAAGEVIRALNLGLEQRFELETAETRASYLRTARFVGRDRELDRLVASGQALVSEPQPPVLVCGEAGIGKTRLLGELKVSLQLEGLPCMLTRPSPVDAAPYGPFLVPLGELLRRVGRAELLERAARGGVLDPALLAEAVGEDPELPERVRRTAALAELVREVAEACPFVLAIDELQSADEGTLELVRALTVGPPSRALLLVTLTEGEPRAADLRADLLGDGAQLVELNRLTRAETARILAAMVSADSVPEAFVARMWEVTGGVPRLIEERMRGLAETDALRTREGALAIHEDAAETLLPEVSLGTLTAQRVARLSPEAAALLAAVAASPRPRPLAFAAALAGVRPSEAEDTVRELERRGFVVRGETVFAPVVVEHEPLRAAALETLGEEGARRLHAKAARLLESRHPATSESPGQPPTGDRAEELGFHLERAGDLVAALRYAAAAGRAALARRELIRARDALEHALLLFDQIERLEADPRQDHLELTLLLAEALGATGARSHAIELLLPIGAPFRSVQGLRLRARLRKDQGDFAAALADLERAVAWAREDAAPGALDAERGLARCLAERASVHLWTASYADARSDGEAAREILEAQLARGQPVAPLLIEVLDELHHACHYAGDEQGAAAAISRGLEIHREHLPTDPRVSAEAPALGDAAPALGDAGGAHVPRSIQAAALARADRAGALGQHYQQRARLLAAAGDLDGAAFASLNLAHLQRARGELGQALDGYVEAHDLFERAQNRVGLALTDLSQARLLAVLGDAAQARCHAEAARDLAAELGARWVLGQARLACAEAALAAADIKRAQAALDEARAFAAELGNVPLQADADLFAGLLADARGDGDAVQGALERLRAAPASARSVPQRLRADLLEARRADPARAHELTTQVLAESERRGLRRITWRAAWQRSQLRRAAQDEAGELEDLVVAMDALRKLTGGLPRALRLRALSQPDCEAARNRFGELR